jgi:hypothetical protein
MNTKLILRQTRILTFSLAGLLSFGAAVQAQDAPPQPPQDGTYADQGQPQQYQNQPYQGQMDPNQAQGPADNYTPDGDPSQDPPSRVARLSYLDGSVSFQPGGQGDWGTATRNRPVTIGDKIWSDNNSKAELQAGQASIHLSSMTALSFLNLDEQTTQLRLAEGTINFRVRELRQGDVYEVDTPNLSFTVTQAGAFRIEVNENGDSTRVTAIRGEGEVNAAGQSYTIHAGERGEFNGTDNVTYFVAGAPAPDDFDRWCNGRDLGEDNSVSARYVSRDVPGYSDLDQNGTWNEEPDYGPVWYPSQVDAGWAPYSDGNWSYVAPWGWTWVGYEPWGFAPYHYGRWAYIGSRWGWCPGPYYAYPVYGPAFVGWLGGGFGFGFGFGFGGGIGWFPLGPHEAFRPWYRTSGIYYRNVNFRNTGFRNNGFLNGRGGFNYAYAHNARAVTVASRNNFVGGQRINRGAYHVTEANLRGAQVSNHAGFNPTRQSFMGASAMRGNIARPSAGVESRSVMTRNAPSAAASHLPTRSFGGGANSGSRGGFNSPNGNRPAAIGRSAQMGAAANSNRPAFSQGSQGSQAYGNQSSRQRELSNDKPQSGMRRTNENPGASRSWSAQGNTTDRGRAPSGFGSESSGRNTAMNRSDRPSWAQGSNRSYSPPERSSGNNGGNNGADRSYNNSSRGYSQPNSGRGAYSQPRSYSAPPSQSRSYSAPSRSYSAPSRSYSAPSRSYSAPSRSNSAPSRSYSAPSHSSGGGGGSHGGGGGGGGSHSSGGGSHGGGGGGGSHGSHH